MRLLLSRAADVALVFTAAAVIVPAFALVVAVVGLDAIREASQRVKAE